MCLDCCARDDVVGIHWHLILAENGTAEKMKRLLRKQTDGYVHCDLNRTLFQVLHRYPPKEPAATRARTIE